MPDFSRAIYGQPFSFNVPLVSRATRPQFQANPTLAAGDVKISLDNGALANITTLPTVSPAGGKIVLVSLTAANMTADKVSIVFSDAAGAEWDDLFIEIAPRKLGSDGIVYRGTVKGAGAESVTLDDDASAVDDSYKDCLAFISDGTGAGQFMRNIPVGYVGLTNVLPIDPAWDVQPVADASEIIIYAAPQVASVSEIAAGVDAAIPAVNIKEVNDIAVTGDGAGTTWGP